MPSNNRRASNRSGSSSRTNDWSTGVMDLARERPIAAAAVAAGAAAAGLFLWSRRSQISNQLSSLSNQIGEWTETMTSGASTGGSFSGNDDTAGLTTSGRTAATRPANRSTTPSMSETGGGNASLGASSGGGGSAGSAGSASGRGRARSTAPTQE